MNVQECLEKLGNDPAEIANSLTKLGIRGRKDNCRHCPLAKYLNNLGGITNLYYGCYQVERDKVRDPNSGSHKLPTVFQQFVEWFDNGSYPNLEE